MKQEKVKIHRNSVDITQRLLAEQMAGQSPLAIFSFPTAKVKDVLSTDLPDVSTADDKADILYLLEDDSLLHIEYQTTTNQKDLERFAKYVLGIYTKYKYDFRIDVLIESVVIYAPHIQRNTVKHKLNISSMHYTFTPIFLSEMEQNHRYDQIIAKIHNEPSIDLTSEEIMTIAYHALFNDSTEKIEVDALQAVKDIRPLKDVVTRLMLSGTIFTLPKKYLSEEYQLKILEELNKMDYIQAEINKMVQAGHEEGFKQAQRKTLIAAIREGLPQTFIDKIIADSKFTKDELDEIYQAAKTF
ncbi:hypothetical protein I6G82_14285 [Lysinibacillus macroides]|uniref:Transposase n=1 Tax=Lysinibacillus macroides TaxID=33935 RepID=A0A0N1J086_9BACI|nr:hypothetical protein [Lysinibacillus macroides]KOY82504.1 hypothetical protein ADM90_03970 [Lysinibacillus macroides]QPR66455.1 hypothetical protein I6G82_14285 [Lysinibacillus macroides]